MKNHTKYLGILSIVIMLMACGPMKYNNQTYELTADQKTYWYSNEAEISTYKLSQARYGEIREGEAAMIFVTEPFNRRLFTKPDGHHNDNVPVLKLNMTKRFNTGIYPYTMMTSTFMPIDISGPSLKLTSSVQEWCGQVYCEMTNDGKLSFDVSSYFEGESGSYKVSDGYLEDDIWSIIKLSPDQLPLGDIQIVPSMFYLRLVHKPLKAYDAIAKFIDGDKVKKYQINYPSLDRSIVISFNVEEPHQILAWEETYPDGFGSNKKTLTTKATLMNLMKSPYWQKNGLQHNALRDSLGLKM